MLDAPTFGPIRLSCDCGHAWDDWQPLDLPARFWVAHCNAYRCPRCGHGPDRIYLAAPKAAGVDA